MNHLTWHETQARRAYLRQVRWERFRDLMAYLFWPAALLIASLILNLLPIGGA